MRAQPLLEQIFGEGRALGPDRALRGALGAAMAIGQHTDRQIGAVERLRDVLPDGVQPRAAQAAHLRRRYGIACRADDHAHSLPVVVAGVTLGLLLFRRINDALFRSAVLGLPMFGGVGLVV
jgi:hypothetical protein